MWGDIFKSIITAIAPAAISLGTQYASQQLFKPPTPQMAPAPPAPSGAGPEGPRPANAGTTARPSMSFGGGFTGGPPIGNTPAPTSTGFTTLGPSVIGDKEKKQQQEQAAQSPFGSI